MSLNPPILFSPIRPSRSLNTINLSWTPSSAPPISLETFDVKATTAEDDFRTRQEKIDKWYEEAKVVLRQFGERKKRVGSVNVGTVVVGGRKRRGTGVAKLLQGELMR